MTQSYSNVAPLKPLTAEVNPAVTFNADGSPRSYLYQLKWDFTAQRKIKKGGPRVLSFSTRLVEPEHIPEIQRAFYRWYQQGTGFSLGTFQIRIHSLFQVVKHLGSTNWKELEDDKCWALFKDNLKAAQLSKKAIVEIFVAVEFVSNRFLQDKRSIALTLCCNTKQHGKQHIAIPEEMGSKLFQKAIDIVEQYHPHRHAISDSYIKYHQLYEKHVAAGKKHFARWFRRHHSHNVPIKGFQPCGLFKHIAEIQAACAIVLLGFSGVRISEMLSFKRNAYFEQHYGDITVSMLSGVTSKGQEGGIPTETTWVTHSIAKLALELAYDMGEYSRDFHRTIYQDHEDQATYFEELESAFITLNIRNKKEGVINNAISKNISKLAKKYGIVATEKDVEEFNLINPDWCGEMKVGGYLPKLSSHDFRRTFAVFLLRNKLGSILALKWQYKHANEFMSRWYGNHSELAVQLDLELDTDLQKIIQEANNEITALQLFEIRNSETLAGKEGLRIIQKRSGGGYYGGEIYTSLDECRSIVKKNNISIVEHPTGYCINPTCSRICASDKSTQICQHEIVTPKKAKDRLPAYYRLTKRFKALNNGQHYLSSVLLSMQLEIKAMEMTFKQLNIKFIPIDELSINCKSIVVKDL